MSLWSGLDRGGDPMWLKGVKGSVVGGAGQASLGPSLKGAAKECVQTRDGCEKWRKRTWRKGRERDPPLV